jgi:5-methylcytosine-specific restriction endonuclease McrA
VNRIRPKSARLRLLPKTCARKYYVGMVGDVRVAARCPTWKFSTRHFRSQAGDDSEENLITLCARCHAGRHEDWIPRSPTSVP